MAKNNHAKTLSDHFLIRMDDELSQWFNDWWKKFSQGELIAEHPPGILYKTLGSHTVALPDTLPLASLANEGSMCARFDETGSLQEYGLWTPQNHCWEPLGKSIIEAVIYYHLSLACSENLFSHSAETDNKLSLAPLSLKACAINIGSGIVSDVEELCNKEPEYAVDVLANAIQNLAKKSADSFRNMTDEYDTDFINSAQRLLSEPIKEKLSENFAQWLVDTIAEKKSDKKLKLAFKKLSADPDFNKIEQAITLNCDHSKGKKDLFTHAIKDLLSDPGSHVVDTDSNQEKFQADLLKEIKFFWKLLRNRIDTLPPFNELKKKQGVALLEVLFNHGICTEAVIHELSGFLVDEELNLSDAEKSQIENIVYTQKHNLIALLTQPASVIDQSQFNHSLAQFIETLHKQPAALSCKHLLSRSQLTSFENLISTDNANPEIIKGLLDASGQQFSAYWSEVAKNAVSAQNYLEAYHGYYLAGWDMCAGENNQSYIDDIISVARKGGFACWDKLASWHKQSD